MSRGWITGPGSAVHSWTREELLRAAEWLWQEGVPVGELQGQLIRPLMAVAGLGDSGAPPAGFWHAALAVQLAHEASLIHDDIVDSAQMRRGEPSLALREGVPRALLHGDHLLTASYRAAAATGNAAFMAHFARAVERTVAGEAAQGRVRGVALGFRRYEQIVLGKSGELLGCALAAAPILAGRSDALQVYELGCRIGLVYQMLDDLLDYCPSTLTGKPALADYRSGRWTWVLDECPEVTLGGGADRVLEMLYGSPSGIAGMARAAKRLAALAETLRGELCVVLGDDGVAGEMLAGWVEQGREAIAREIEQRSGGSRAARPVNPESDTDAVTPSPEA
jgi:hypothetical protein